MKLMGADKKSRIGVKKYWKPEDDQKNEYNRRVFEILWTKKESRREKDKDLWKATRECGRAWEAPGTPNKECEENEINYGRYGHMEPSTTDSIQGLLGKFGHVAPDTPVSLGFQSGGEEPSPGKDKDRYKE